MQTTVPLPPLIPQKQLAEYLGKSEAWLERARLTGDGPPYVKVGRGVRYPADLLKNWMQSNLMQSTCNTSTKKIGRLSDQANGSDVS